MHPEIQLCWKEIERGDRKAARQALLKACIAQINNPIPEATEELLKLEGACTALDILEEGSEEEKKQLFELVKNIQPRILENKEARALIAEAKPLADAGKLRESEKKLKKAIKSLTNQSDPLAIEQLEEVTRKIASLRACYVAIKTNREEANKVIQKYRKKSQKKT